MTEARTDGKTDGRRAFHSRGTIVTYYRTRGQILALLLELRSPNNTIFQHHDILKEINLWPANTLDKSACIVGGGHQPLCACLFNVLVYTDI